MATLIHKTFTLIALTLLGVDSLSAQQVHRWVDAEGIVHYSEEAPGHARNVKSIDLYPGPSAEQIEQAEGVAEQNRQMAEQFTQERLQREAKQQAELEAARAKAQQQAQKPIDNKQAQVDSQNDSTVIIVNCPNGLVHNGKCIQAKPDLPLKRPKPENPVWKPVTPAELRQQLK